MIDLILFLISLLSSISGIPQLYRCFKRKSCDDLSLIAFILVFFGIGSLLILELIHIPKTFMIIALSISEIIVTIQILQILYYRRIKMLEVKCESNETPIIRVRDLKEGDIAIIEYSGLKILVYIFRATESSPRSMVALDRKRTYWSGINYSNLLVIEVLKPDTLLKVM